MGFVVKRRHFICPRLDDPGTFEDKEEHTNDRHECRPGKANLVGSQIKGSQLHAPVLDLDFPARLVPSTTPGHHHLYLDLHMPWESYEKLLRVLGEIGVLEPGYVDASIRRKQTFVRKPGVKKQPGSPDSSGGKSRRKKRLTVTEEKHYS